jgi:RNA recognition motif-containing protein
VPNIGSCGGRACSPIRLRLIRSAWLRSEAKVASIVCAELAAAAQQEMEGDAGKLFIGGISWDTNEDRLREYFDKYGEVVEAVIMRDRATGRARGFGFIVFADPAVAERVIMEKHMIDGRMVSNSFCL